MAYNDVFGGELIFPSLLSYNQITFGSSITLQWAREQQIGGVNVVADFMDMGRHGSLSDRGHARGDCYRYRQQGNVQQHRRELLRGA